MKTRKMVLKANEIKAALQLEIRESLFNVMFDMTLEENKKEELIAVKTRQLAL